MRKLIGVLVLEQTKKIMNEIKCPICNKVGIADYKNEEVTCPACNTDLSVFALLDKENQKRIRVKNALIGFSALLIILMIFISIFSSQTKEKLINRLSSNEVLIRQMHDSVVVLQSQLYQLRSNVNNLPGKSVQNYIIRKGDSFCLISTRLYGNEKRAQELADLNKRKLNSFIYPGDTLIVPQN